MPIRWIPDGNGGFIKDTVPSGFESIGVMILIVGAALVTPLMIGMFGSLTLFEIIKVIFPALSVLGAILSGIILTLLFLVLSIPLYSTKYHKMSASGKIAWAFVILSFAISPISSLFWTYGAELGGIGSSAKVIKFQDNFPFYDSNLCTDQGTHGWQNSCSQDPNGSSDLSVWTLYSVRNTGNQNIDVHLDYFHSPCFAENDATFFTLAPNQEQSFACETQYGYRRSNGEIEIKYPETCIAVSPFQVYASEKHRKFCQANNWK
ncbi:MAG: hypothetical protein UW41_C0021G0017 [Candidatus Collierbacteria bacterium GW2011_GWC2_44_18]|uniref:Uncharacterized protein n=2 Tax=Microgenomates group TaxID=1794810 RepID=A0A0G1J6K6_9BACT|nr:MAG: hypothetical protein UW16_C0016G0006 [Microgenomates group bacterium GW2011_GWC1_44_10]KKT48691.1 MAG: hypothetical protein UW41_C0021G0017 [Candidatus Collierbacteria bacterium GW2011_GWC2_44_18]KKT66993.1 MAG: hypothetical protein UW60_C0016G0012 [Candidatus Woesebacteria bacterium GW2011_GWA2_44_33]